jgi:hypothetical protein
VHTRVVHAGAPGRGKLATAIAVPVAGVALLAAGLLLWLRQRRRVQQLGVPGPSYPSGKHQSQTLPLGDVDLERPASRDLMDCSVMGHHEAITDQEVSQQPVRSGPVTGPAYVALGVARRPAHAMAVR